MKRMKSEGGFTGIELVLGMWLAGLIGWGAPSIAKSISCQIKGDYTDACYEETNNASGTSTVYKVYVDYRSGATNAMCPENPINFTGQDK